MSQPIDDLDTKNPPCNKNICKNCGAEKKNYLECDYCGTISKNTNELSFG